MDKPFIKIYRERLNRTILSKPDNNGIVGYEFTYNWHNFPIYVHSLGRVKDRFFFKLPGETNQLHLQVITHNEHTPDTTTEYILTFTEESDIIQFLIDVLDGDKAPLARFNPDMIKSQDITQIDYI